MEDSSFNPTKRRRIAGGEIEAYPFKVHLKFSKLEFDDTPFPVLLKVGWIENNVALETRTKNALVGCVSFSKKLKRVVEFAQNQDPICYLTICQKVGHGFVHVGFTHLNISQCFQHFGQDFKIVQHLEGVVGRSAHIEVNAAIKPHQPGKQEFGSTTFSSKIFNLFPNIHHNQPEKLSAFEDIYFTVLEDYEHIFSLDAILEHSDLCEYIVLEPENSGLEPNELASIQELLISLNLFQEKANPHRWRIAPYSFDLAAFKRVVLYYQERVPDLGDDSTDYTTTATSTISESTLSSCALSQSVQSENYNPFVDSMMNMFAAVE